METVNNEDIDGDSDYDYFRKRAANIFKKKAELCKNIHWEEEEELPVKEDNSEKEIGEQALLDKIKEKILESPQNRKKKAKKREEVEIVEVVPKKIPCRRQRREKNKCEYDDMSDVVVLQSPAALNLPAASKRRLKALEKRTLKEQQQLAENARRILDPFDDELPPAVPNPPSAPSVHRLRVRYKSDLFRIEVGENERFSSVYDKVAALCRLKASEIILCRGDDNIAHEDTPASLRIQVIETIECIPYRPPVDETSDPNKILIKLQSDDKREKVEIFAHKMECFSNVMSRYARLRGLPPDQLTFEFDGERIAPSDTPSDLDMEDGCCVDVRAPSRPAPSPRECPGPPPPPIPLVDICFLD